MVSALLFTALSPYAGESSNSRLGTQLDHPQLFRAVLNWTLRWLPSCTSELLSSNQLEVGKHSTAFDPTNFFLRMEAANEELLQSAGKPQLAERHAC